MISKLSFPLLVLALLALPIIFITSAVQSRHTQGNTHAFAAALPTPTPNPIQQPTLPNTPPIPVSSCMGNISQSGNYVLTQDITQPDGSLSPCIEFSNVNGVSLDCQNHTIAQGAHAMLAVSTPASGTVSNFVLKNCSFSGSAPAIINANLVQVTNNTVNLPPDGETMRIGTSQNVLVSGNTIVNGALVTSASSFVELSNNAVKRDAVYQSADLSGTIEADYSNHLNIVGNSVDGSWDGLNPSVAQPSSDDGIMIIDGSNDYIADNTIKNAWDCGIETEGQITSSQFINNTINNIGYCAIGGWYQSSWLNNLVEGNQVSLVKIMLQFYLNTQFLTLSNNPTTYYFQGNQFIGNAFLSGTPSNSNSANVNYHDLSQAPGVTPVLGSNTFTNNNFGTFDIGPNLLPTSMVIDGGGNTCAADPFASLALACAMSPSPSATATPAPTVQPTPAPTATPSPTAAPMLTPTANPTPTALPTPTPDTIPPTTPTNLTATAVSSSQINLSWTAATDNAGSVTYNVYRNNTFLISVATTSLGDTGLSAATTYTYFVVAQDQSGNTSQPSAAVSATTQPIPVANGAISGTVTHRNSPVASVKVSVVVGGSPTTTYTNRNGQYTLGNLPPATYTVTFSKKHYATQSKTVTVGNGQTVFLNVSM